MKKTLFGTSSEQATKELAEQLSLLFNEAEVWRPIEEEPIEDTAVSVHMHQKRSSDLDEILQECVAVETVKHSIPEEERVRAACGTMVEQIGKEFRCTLVLYPATATIREVVYYTYACQKCRIEMFETPPLISGSYVSPEIIAHIMVQKFVVASPLYQQEQGLNRSDIQLSQQTMSNWILRASDD